MLLALGLAHAQEAKEAGMGSGYMLAFPMDESGMVAAESSPQVAAMVLPEGALEESKKEENPVPTVETPADDAAPVANPATDDGKAEVLPTEAPSSTPAPTTTTTKAPYKAPSEADRRRKIEEMRKILGLPPTGQKPKYVHPEKPKSILPALLLKAALPKLHDSRLSDILPIPLSLMRRSDSGTDSQGAGARIAALSNIFHVASAFMRRTMQEDESETQNVRNSKKNSRSKNSGKNDMMLLLDDDRIKNLLSSSDKDDEDDDDDDDLPFLPFTRPFPVPFRMPFGGPPPQGGAPFGLPRHPMGQMMGPRRMPPMMQSRSFPRIPMHPSQYPPRPVQFHHQPMMAPQPFHMQPQHPMAMPAHPMPMFAPFPQPQQQQIIMLIPQRPQPQHMSQHMSQHIQFIPQHQPFQMGHQPTHFEHMQAASHHVPSPIQPVLLMLHPMALPQHMPMRQPMMQPMMQFRQPPIQYRNPQVEYRNAPDMEEDSDDREPEGEREGAQESPRYVMLLDNSIAPSPRGMPQMQYPQMQYPQGRTFHQPQGGISPLRKMQIIREIIMARQSMVPRPSLMASHRQGSPAVFPFHPPVPRLVPKMMAELRQKTGERLAAASILRPIFMQAGL